MAHGRAIAEDAYNGGKIVSARIGGNMENGKAAHCCPVCGREWPSDYFPNAKVYCGQCAYDNCQEAREKLRQIALASSDQNGWKILW